MKRLTRLPKLLILVTTVMLLQGCVAKKKFVAMEDSRNRAENRVRELTVEVETLTAGFEQFKNEFHYSNAQKNNYIDSLNKEIGGLKANLTGLDENLSDQVLSSQVEKRRLTQQLAERDNEIRTLKQNTASAQTRINDLENEIQSQQIKLRDASSTQNALRSEITQKNSEIERLKENLNQRVTEINTLRTQLAEREDRIEVLQNQVKLLRSQLGIN